MASPKPIAIIEQLKQDRFRPEEVADLLDIPVAAVRQAVFSGELQATTLEHHILSIPREALLDWLAIRAEA